MGQKIVLTSALKGFLGTSLLLIFYFSIVTLISGWDFAQGQFFKYWYFIVVLAFGFGVQIGLYAYLKEAIQGQNHLGKVVAVSGTTSAVAMISCCSHYLVNILPIIGITGLITIISQFQVQLFWVGLAFNLGGITFMANRIFRYSNE